jgi:A/G-specific adenine glycosylase
MEALFSKKLLRWYDQAGRKNLPWRENITPYYVWVSEIMLQQTQVKTVIPYFTRFITHFPTIVDLAQASEDEVLHLWTGLGYYARARYLHDTAKKICSLYLGKFPSDIETLQSLKGIGRSTAGAILAIAFNQHATILDANVVRVLTRFHALEGLPSEKKMQAKLWEIAHTHTPKKRTADYTQAIMDLGATLCVRTKPLCNICPVSAACMAYLNHTPSSFPTPKLRTPIPLRSTYMLILHNTKANTVLLEKRPSPGIWGGLWSFPECPTKKEVEKWSDAKLKIKTLKKFTHVFTHFRLDITPIYITQHTKKTYGLDFETEKTWYPLDNAPALGLPTPIKKILATLHTTT